MRWGIENNERVEANPKQKANCEICNGELIAKCGEIKIWHWAHKSKIECDDWWEPESEWHRNWKNEFPKEQQEVRIGKHRADVKTRTGRVIEFQASSISPKRVREREKFYGSMIWLLNGEKFKELYVISHVDNSHNHRFYSWRWKRKPLILKSVTKPIFVDSKYGIIKIGLDKYHCCNIYSKEQFLQIYGDIFKKEVKNDNNLQQART